jgi:hypothetical protein
MSSGSAGVVTYKQNSLISDMLLFSFTTVNTAKDIGRCLDKLFRVCEM